MWKLADDATGARTGPQYMPTGLVEGFPTSFGPLVASQEVKLLTAAPWGPRPGGSRMNPTVDERIE